MHTYPDNRGSRFTSTATAIRFGAIVGLAASCMLATAIPRAVAQPSNGASTAVSVRPLASVPAVTTSLAAPASTLKPPAAMKPITRLHVSKTTHTLTAYAADGTMVLTRQVALGFGGPGPKLQEGDHVTPVGRYHVINHSWSPWREFMLIDYPNADDRARFARLKAAGTLPANATIGGQVGIHGSPQQPEAKATHKQFDWTFGCVALDDQEIAELAKLVRNGTIIDIDD
jgi:murein L,D-transpeptidase YafK